MIASQPTTRLRRILLHPLPLTLVILTALWMLFFWRLLTPDLADSVVFAEGDFTQHYYAFASYAAERLWQGQLPLWNPYNHAGAPFIANVQWATWYPLQLLTILLAGRGGLSIEAYQFLTAGHVWLASLLTYAFLRVALPTDGDDPRDTEPPLLRHKRHWAALIGAITFAYGGYLTGYPILQPSIMMAATWLPLLLLGLHLSGTRVGWSVGGTLIAGLAMGISFLGGHPQTTLYITYAGLAYLVFVGWQARLPWYGILWRGVLFGAVGGGLSAVQLLPALEYTALTARVAEYGYANKAAGFAPIELLQVVWPQPDGAWSPLYVGVAGFVLALGSLRKPRPIHLFWAGVIGVALLLSLGANAVVYDAFYNVAPGFSTFRQQERAALLVSFGLSVLAAYQLHRLLDTDAIELRFDRLASGYATLTVGGLLFAVLTNTAGDGSLLPPGTLAGRGFAGVLALTALFSLLLLLWAAWSAAGLRPLWLAASLLAALIVVDLFTTSADNQNYVPDTPENRVVQPGGYEMIRPVAGEDWRVDGALGLQGYGTYFRVPDVYSTGPFALAAVTDLLAIPVDRFWEVLSVRYASLPLDVEPPVPANWVGEYANYTGETYRLYELADPRPFVWLVYDYRDASGSAEFAREIMADSRVDLRRMAVTLDPLPLDLPGTPPAGISVTWQRPRPELIQIDAATPANALLTVSLPRYPGWQAAVDGQPVQTVDVYAGLTGIPLPPGDHHVELRFRPKRVIIGGLVSALTLLACAGYGVFVFVRRLRALDHNAGAAV